MQHRAMLIAIFLLASAVPSVASVTLTVNSNGDQSAASPAACTGIVSASTVTLRSAIEAAEACGGGTIAFSGVTGTITLGSELPKITQPLTITGPGAATLTVSGNNAVRILRIDAGASIVSISGLTLANGVAAGQPGSDGQGNLGGGGGGAGAMGGAIYVASGNVDISNVAFSNNLATGGTGGDAPNNFVLYALYDGDGGNGGNGDLGGTGGAGGVDTPHNNSTGYYAGGAGGGGGASGGIGGSNGQPGDSAGGGGSAGGKGGGIAGGGGGSGGGCGGGSAHPPDSTDFGGVGGTGYSGCEQGGGGGGGGGLGGAVFVGAGTVTFNTVTFSNNSADGGAAGAGWPTPGLSYPVAAPGLGKGGAIFVDTGGAVVNTNPTYSSNSASDALTLCSDNNNVYSRGGYGGEAPTNITLSNDSVYENKPVNTIVGNLSTTDPDCTDHFTYSLVTGSGDTNNAQFTILSGNVLVTNAILDYEAGATRSIRVRTTDSFGNTFEKILTITILNVDEPPVIAAVTFSTNEDTQISVPAPGALTNDYDPEGAPIDV
ncbi:MAG TPA: Ig-like domain-containing protein, partial [Thermoanaerobaculia bacterium]|nr:Ig-like domain-containing protein [Thermoanaerobaculia bacterium]